MANTKITQLTSTSSANGQDLFVIVTDTTTTATTKSIQVVDLFGNVSVNANFSSNVLVTPTKIITVGNSTGNTVITNNSISISNSTVQTNVTNIGLRTGSIVVNNLGVYVGSNTIVNSSTFFSGNATVNLSSNSTIIKFSNSTATANLSIANLAIGLSTVNSSGVYVGANVSVNSTSFKVGNSSVNVFTNSSTIVVGANVVVNNTTVALGGATQVNASSMIVGNSTSNATINSTALYVTNTTVNVAITIPTTTQYSATNVFLHANSSWATPEEHMIVDVSRDESTNLTSGTDKFVFYAPFAMTLTRIPKATLSANSTSGDVTLDINEAGVSVLSTLLTIDANEDTSTTAATPAVLADTTIADNARVSIDVDDAGTGAKGLKVTFYYKRT
jgi:hypothetical protein